MKFSNNPSAAENSKHERFSSTVFERIKGGLIVSCQALPDEPLYGSDTMAKMAYAAQQGGAVGIRANSTEDILAIREMVDLPIIGIIKKEFTGCTVYITPTDDEVAALIDIHVDIVAMDATQRLRPDGSTLESFFTPLRSRYPDTIFMADCATLEDAILAQQLGFNCVSTTLCGYTESTKNIPIPSLSLIRAMADKIDLPVIAEGGIWTPDQLVSTIQNGAWAAVVGTAITRPMEIVSRYHKALCNWQRAQLSEL